MLHDHHRLTVNGDEYNIHNAEVKKKAQMTPGKVLVDSEHAA
jgi:hypothetical protein